MRFTDKIKYYAYPNDWTTKPDFEFMASVVASERDVINAIMKKSWFDDKELYVERVGTNAIKPDFHVYRLGFSGIIYYVRPEKSS